MKWYICRCCSQLLRAKDTNEHLEECSDHIIYKNDTDMKLAYEILQKMAFEPATEMTVRKLAGKYETFVLNPMYLVTSPTLLLLKAQRILKGGVILSRKYYDIAKCAEGYMNRIEKTNQQLELISVAIKNLVTLTEEEKEIDETLVYI